LANTLNGSESDVASGSLKKKSSKQALANTPNDSENMDSSLNKKSSKKKLVNTTTTSEESEVANVNVAGSLNKKSSKKKLGNTSTASEESEVANVNVAGSLKKKKPSKQVLANTSNASENMDVSDTETSGLSKKKSSKKQLANVPPVSNDKETDTGATVTKKRKRLSKTEITSAESVENPAKKRKKLSKKTDPVKVETINIPNIESKIPDNDQVIPIKKSKATEMGISGNQVVNVDNVVGAVTTLLDLVSKNQGNKKQLLEDAQMITIIITLHRITPKKRPKPYIIDIPHSLQNESTDICVFVKDPAKTYKELFREIGVPNVKKVVGIESLRNKYHQYEARRKLLQSYDLFLCDENISLVLNRLLGKTFINTKRFPRPIRIKKTTLAQNVARARDSTYLYLTSGSCVNVKIAKTSMDVKEISENILSSLDQIVKNIPGEWENIQSLNIKTNDSMAIPFYNNLKNVVTINAIEISGKGKKKVKPTPMKTE